MKPYPRNIEASNPEPKRSAAEILGKAAELARRSDPFFGLNLGHDEPVALALLVAGAGVIFDRNAGIAHVNLMGGGT